ncbi:hypothetical protein Zm00014a_030985 [Zea mays]|uniref:Uncharacterized protein n=1 Tax=Zea mays TaxID=4577 RepID=A0A3L6DQE3_MAIZE|nr:hypothetical protein Zm00014a_030985 [Zea mays]
MKTFDPWPVFFRREWKRNWPFLTGFAITGFIITKMTANFTEEDLKNSNVFNLRTVNYANGARLHRHRDGVGSMRLPSSAEPLMQLGIGAGVL